MSNQTPNIIESIDDAHLRELVRLLLIENSPSRIEKLRARIVEIIEKRERDNFLVRFVLRDFKTWNKVLKADENDSANAKKNEFYESHLIAVLRNNGGQLEPLKAIEMILERVKDKLTLADFALTASKRFRYDTAIRFLADDLKKRGVLSKEKRYKNKVWALVKNEKHFIKKQEKPVNLFNLRGN